MAVLTLACVAAALAALATDRSAEALAISAVLAIETVRRI